MTDVYDAIKKYNELRDTGENVEYQFGDETTIGLEGGSKTRYDSVGDAFVGIGSSIAGIGAGATSATLGLPSDIASLVVGIKDAVSAEDGQKIDAFTKGFSEFSKANLGSEYFRGVFDNFIDSNFPDIDPKLKEDAKSGFSAGEFGGVGGIATAGAKAGIKTIKGFTKPELGPKLDFAPEGTRGNKMPSSLLVKNNNEANVITPVTQTFIASNKKSNFDNMDTALTNNPDALKTNENWLKFENETMGGEFLPVPPLQAIK